MTIETLREELHFLEDEARHLGNRLDHCLDANSPQANAIDRKLTIVWRMVSEKREQLEHAESGSARAAAEARLAFHIENDTLDMY